MKKLTLGQKIKQARLDKGMTQQNVVGNFITRNMLSKIENDVANPSIRTIEYLSTKLDKPISYFLEDLVNLSEDSKSDAELAFEHSSYMIKNKEIEKCISYLENMLSKSTFNSSDIYYGRLLYNIGSCYNDKSQFSKAERHLKKSIDILERNSDFYYLAKSYYALGKISFFKKDYPLAEELLKKAVGFLKKSYVQDIMAEVKLHYNLSLCLVNQENYPEALKTILYSLEVSRENHYLYYNGYFHMLAGNILNKINNVTKAISHVEKAITFFDLYENFELKATCQKNLGYYSYKKQLYCEAKKHYFEALSYFEENNNISKINSIKVDILMVLTKERKYPEALEYAKDVNKDYLNIKEISELYNSIGKAYLALENINEANYYLLEAEKFALKKDDPELLSDIYASLAELYSKNDDYKNAYTYSTKSSELLKKSVNNHVYEK